MSLPAAALPSIQDPIFHVIRESANYHPAIWGEHFLTYDSSLSKTTNRSSIDQQYEGLKQEVRRMFLTSENDKPSAQKLRLIDAVERLGIAYHFKSEIEDALNKINSYRNEEDDLYIAALRFRLLRQQGINVSCDTFDKFKDGEGNFKASLIHDILGMLSLYEAAHLAIRGEDILDEAIAFTTSNLQSVLTHVNTPLAEKISRALNRPIRKCLPRLEARHYISVYSGEEFHNETLLRFAKLDFNILQGLHQKEVNDIIEWWKRLDVTTKFPYARDRIVECYFWIMGVYFEPQYSVSRKMLTKVIATLSLLDDTYDNYGTTEELELFTEAIQRWEITVIHELPECMKWIYHIMIDVYNEIEEDLANEGRSHCMHYAKEAMKRTVRFYLVEARWRKGDYVPTIEEYMHVSLVSTCYPMLATTSFLGMGDLATKEAFEWVSNDPMIVRASSIVCRLMDDIVGHEFEQKRKHVASSVECYMKQHGVSQEEVVKLFRKEIANAWKDINEECLKCLAVPMPLLERVLNLTRAIDIIYKDDDGYTNSYMLKDYVASLLKDPVLL